ncbi:SDR family NAD(P)-dependent oxidoreductase [Dyella sp. LX-66]|uniref:SDR family NAD(P)-dependent oxidoreductase n=1 Tax=unclassified Dyella TaxID=2634549 RepID=UPI001BE0E9F6|nr:MULTISPECIES: SDR family NAD(P)-dependent oxidoreductase [unclassified Dyella]MBT2118916.1 SDR family NAD(P)-dependent oxidoreductase [Dyella sp. LX-1]MBT2140090.1 SDR family NAD(P)-dependent oxidoreductase [Dyella sp. LX-66]
MTNRFGVTSTTGEVLAGIDLRGKRILITGVSAGLGIETARALVAHGASVVGAARDLDKAERATIGVRAVADATGGRLDLIALDLASLESVRACSSQLVADGHPFDIIIANAGVMATPFGRTSDGFETQFGTNHLGHFLLVNRLTPLLADNGRLVNLSSAGHRLADVDLEDPHFARTSYDPWTAYGRSKTANVLFAVEFDRRHRSRGIRACAVMPGVIGDTGLGKHLTQDDMRALLTRTLGSIDVAGSAPLQFKTVQQGAATSVWAAVVADGGVVGGRYCEDCRAAEISDNGDMYRGVRSYAIDVDSAKKLWAKSEDLIGERF